MKYKKMTILKLFGFFKSLLIENKSNLKFLLKIFSLVFFSLLVHISFTYKYGYLVSPSEFLGIFPYSLTFIALLSPVFFFKKPKLYFILFFFVLFSGIAFDCFYLLKYNAFLGRGVVATLSIATVDSVLVVLSSMSWASIIMSLLGLIFALLIMILLVRFFLKCLADTHQDRRFAILLIVPFVIYSSVGVCVMKLPSFVMSVVKPIPMLRLVGHYHSFVKKNSTLLNIAQNPKVPENIAAKSKGMLGIVVVGESATRYNHSLFGYERETNPKLSMLKDEIVLFDDVVAKIALTCEAFEYAFLLRDENKTPIATIGDILLNADFDVYYISATSTYISINAPQKLLFSNVKIIDPERITGNLDQDLLLYVKNNVNINPEKNTLIFLGLNGSHAPYKKHYPDEFKIFNDDAEISIFKGVNQEERQILNDYDNSLIHTDSFLFDIIKYFSKSDKDTFLLYFSDHGDAPFNDQFKYRHAKEGYPYNYEIPMFLWYSENYKLHNPENVINSYNNKSKPFQTYELLYSILDLATVSFTGFAYEKSFASDKFIDQNNRYIFEGSILYDKSKRSISDYEK